MPKNEKNNNYLICKAVHFYCNKDENIFFEWIKKIKCIENFDGAGDELYLDLMPHELEYDDMKELIALFYRYKIRMDQLGELINEKNKAAADPWMKKIFPKKKI